MKDNIAIPIAGQSPSPQRTTNPHPLWEVLPTRNVRSLYIHVPFCFHKCHYCDFYSIVDSKDRQGAFAERLIAEFADLAPYAGPLETIFVGGGTPTLMGPEPWIRVLEALDRYFDLAPIRLGQGEFSVECNPETASPELFDILREGGVGRISIGAQSFDPAHLKTLERWHDPASVPRAIGLAKAAGIERQSLDLIFAIPGQSLEDFGSDLGMALGLGVSHVSCYSLTYEPNTAMTRRLGRGEFVPAEEDLEIEMQDLAIRMCAKDGLDRYEISNFARRGHECAHNLVYWRQSDWLCAGPSASGHVAGWRWKNVPILREYLSSEKLPPAVDVEPPDPARAIGERLMTGLRLREGVGWDEIVRVGGGLKPGMHEGLISTRDRLMCEGYLEHVGERLVASESGLRFADLIAREFLGVLL